MLAKRIIPCLDIKSNLVVKGKKFKNHKIVGSILEMAEKYSLQGADELVFYDIEASSKKKVVDVNWIFEISKLINIPFCVAGGIKKEKDVERILSFGADKISINSPAILDPSFISRIASNFGSQCTVIGIDSWFNKKTKKNVVYKFSGSQKKIRQTKWMTEDWIKEVQDLGAGEIVLNVMNQDGMRNGYDIPFFKKVRKICHVPLIASGGAGSMQDFYEIFSGSNVDGALAASVFHKNILTISELKKFLFEKKVEIRKC